MKLKFLSSALFGQAITLTAQQGDATVGPIEVASWGDAMGTGGPIQITVDRSTLMCAPDSVRFSVDLSQSHFDTSGPVAGANYDPRLCELIYLWDTGRTGAWDAPENILPEWNDKSKAKGPFIGACYETPGIKTVSVIVMEPSSGKVSQATTQVEVQNPDVVFSGNQTVCLNAAGHAGTAWGPPNAVYYTMDGVSPVVSEQAWWNGYNNGTKARFLLDPAQDYSDGVAFLLGASDDPEHFSLHGYGGRVELPDIRGTLSEGRVVYTTVGWRGNGSNEVPDCRISNVNVTGSFDSTQNARTGPLPVENHNGALIRANRAADYVVQNCNVNNNKSTAFMFYGNNNNVGHGTPAWQGAGAYDHQKFFSHLDNCSTKRFGGRYSGMFWGFHDTFVDSAMSVTGCHMSHDPNAIVTTEWACPFRENGHHKVHLQCSDQYTKDPGNTPWKMCTTPFNDQIPHIINIDGVTAEGGGGAFHVLQNIDQYYTDSYDVNMVVDGAIIVGDYAMSDFFHTCATGIQLRNILGILPDVPAQSGHGFGFDMNTEENPADPYIAYTTRLFETAIQTELHGGITSVQLAQPIHATNCTFVVARPLADNKSTSTSPIRSYLQTRTLPNTSPATNVQFNNVLWDGEWDHQLGNPHPYGALSTEVLFAPLNIGWKGYQTKVLHTHMATPVDAIRSYAPPIGSEALGAALNGPTAYFDIKGQQRPVYPSIGAWEVTGA